MNSRVDYSTIIGMTMAFVLIAIAITTHSSIIVFWDTPSALIVIGGTLAVTTACYSLPEMLRAQVVVFRTIFSSSTGAKAASENMLELSEEARKNGLLALQTYVNTDDGSPFFRKGLSMIVDGMEPEVAEKIMRQDIASMSERHSRGVAILRKSADVAPAMGLIGTLIGLVQMLGNLSDPSKIGPAMAMALLGTLYGAVLSYVIFSPLATKLERNSREEVLLNSLYMKGVYSIGKKENPRRMEMMFNTLLPPTERLNYFES